MERYRLLGIEHGGRESASARVVSREPNKWGVFPLHTFNSGDEVVLAADAQATIATLQARVRELESELGCPTWVCDCCGRVSSTGWINIVNETMDGIDYDMECPNCHTRQIEEDSAADLARERDEFEAQLTQRTAELEAAKAIQAIDLKNNNAYREQVATLQAELERVRADNKALDEWRADVTVSLQRPGGAFFVDVPQHIKDLVKERDDLRTLLLALPKVEGEITCSQQFDSAWRLHYWQVEAYGVADECLYRLSNLREEEAKAYAALLKHRQGLT